MRWETFLFLKKVEIINISKKLTSGYAGKMIAVSKILTLKITRIHTALKILIHSIASPSFISPLWILFIDYSLKAWYLRQDSCLSHSNQWYIMVRWRPDQIKQEQLKDRDIAYVMLYDKNTGKQSLNTIMIYNRRHLMKGYGGKLFTGLKWGNNYCQV